MFENKKRGAKCAPVVISLCYGFACAAIRTLIAIAANVVTVITASAFTVAIFFVLVFFYAVVIVGQNTHKVMKPRACGLCKIIVTVFFANQHRVFAVCVINTVLIIRVVFVLITVPKVKVSAINFVLLALNFEFNIHRSLSHVF
jgi:hypothetical protein